MSESVKEDSEGTTVLKKRRKRIVKKRVMGRSTRPSSKSELTEVSNENEELPPISTPSVRRRRRKKIGKPKSEAFTQKLAIFQRRERTDQRNF